MTEPQSRDQGGKDFTIASMSTARTERGELPDAGERLRVAYLVPPSRGFAGVERVVHEIATGLMEAHGDLLDVHVLFAREYEDHPVRGTLYTMHVLGVNRLRGLAAAVRANVATHCFDVLVCAQVESSVVAWFATRRLRLPVFVTHLHGNPRIEENEGSMRTKIAFVLFRHIISRHVSGVLAVSPSQQRYARQSLARRANVYFAKNPARDLGTACPRTVDHRFRFLTLARLSRQKGLDILLRALAIARPDLPAVTLTVAGKGPDEAELRRLCSDLGLDDVVDFVGYIADPADLFHSADCFVLASRWEGFPLVLLEALHAGLPVLSTDCEFGPADLITDPRIGELVPAGSPEALGEGMKQMVLRAPDANAEAYRRATAGAYSRQAATESHYAALRQIVARC
jgi:glycosyltransferase involved in cell wall biosynthesis